MAEARTETAGTNGNGSLERLSVVSLGQSCLGSTLYDVLRELGHKVFLDQTALKPGDQLVKELQDA